TPLPSLPQRVRVALQLRLACKALLNPQKLDQTRKQVTFPRTAPFLFWSTHKFSMRRRAIPWEISRRTVKGPESGAHNELIAGNGPRFCRVFAGISREPMPVIGIRRVIMQCREHDDDRAAPVVALRLEIPMALAFQPAPPEQGAFLGGPGC